MRQDKALASYLKEKKMNPCSISLFGLYQTPTLLIKWRLISRCYLCNSAVLRGQRALHLGCLQVPSHVEQRLQELERGMRSEHRGMGRERRIDQQAGVSDKLQEVTLPFAQSLTSLSAPPCSHIHGCNCTDWSVYGKKEPSTKWHKYSGGLNMWQHPMG